MPDGAAVVTFGREGPDVKFEEHRVLPWPPAPVLRPPGPGMVNDFAGTCNVSGLEHRSRIRHLQLAIDAELVQAAGRSEEHTSELQSLMRISDAVFCLTQ